jgi:hypothetical protein
MSGGALLIAVVLGVLWGFAETTGLADVDNDTTTTTVAALASGETTTTTTGDPDDEADPNQPDPGGNLSTTTTSGSGASGGSGGSSGGSGTTAPPNRAPIIVDPGLSSNGLVLSITPTLTDPDGDDVDFVLNIDGQDAEPTGGTVTTGFALDDVGYSHNAIIVIRATDTAGNETVETFSHTVEAVTTVTISDVKFRVESPSVCFEDTAAERLGGNLDLKGSITENIRFSEELRPDRTEVILLDELSGETVGGPGELDVKMLGGFAGLLDLYEENFTVTLGFSVTMFTDTQCKGVFSFNLEVTTS